MLIDQMNIHHINNTSLFPVQPNKSIGAVNPLKVNQYSYLMRILSESQRIIVFTLPV